MSKTSKPADLWRQLDAAATDRDGFCSGCGYHFAVYSEHRADCTAVPLPASWCPHCKYHPAVHGHHRADCTSALQEATR